MPPPFYRSPNGKIRVPDSTEKITFVVVSQAQRLSRGGDVDVYDEIRIVRGWCVSRAAHTLGYYLGSVYGDHETLAHTVVDLADEHKTWMRGWDDETFAALSATWVMQ